MMMQLVEKQRLIEFAEALRSRLNYFDELENVRFGKHRCHITKICIFYFMKKNQIQSILVLLSSHLTNHD
jgi:hypothetical protein